MTSVSNAVLFIMTELASLIRAGTPAAGNRA